MQHPFGVGDDLDVVGAVGQAGDVERLPGDRLEVGVAPAGRAFASWGAPPGCPRTAAAPGQAVPTRAGSPRPVRPGPWPAGAPPTCPAPPVPPCVPSSRGPSAW